MQHFICHSAKICLLLRSFFLNSVTVGVISVISVISSMGRCFRSNTEMLNSKVLLRSNMLKFRFYLQENGKDFLEDTTNILCGLGEQTQIATRYTSKPSLLAVLT